MWIQDEKKCRWIIWLYLNATLAVLIQNYYPLPPRANTPFVIPLSVLGTKKRKLNKRQMRLETTVPPLCCAPSGTWALCKWVKMTRFRQKYLCCLVRLFNYKYKLGEAEEFSPLRNILDWIESSTMVGIRWWWHSCVYALKIGLHDVKNKCMMFSLYLYYTLGEKPWGIIYAQTCELCWKQQHGVKQVFSGLCA